MTFHHKHQTGDALLKCASNVNVSERANVITLPTLCLQEWRYLRGLTCPSLHSQLLDCFECANNALYSV